MYYLTISCRLPFLPADIAHDNALFAIVEMRVHMDQGHNAGFKVRAGGLAGLDDIGIDSHIFFLIEMKASGQTRGEYDARVRRISLILFCRFFLQRLFQQTSSLLSIPFLQRPPNKRRNSSHHDSHQGASTKIFGEGASVTSSINVPTRSSVMPSGFVYGFV
ncbi:uncharacterized protein BYT42DRAFT_573440 [Radiomyces spectabilis]|uniref:uncharacterized protein n=1 Tax=Radiomyces spectabilis TaxID=64574 RepID=UPI00221F9767|nr:uncharacterized protein BYT42DRAFT_573440 [Radiomyces spectabilis]KAI8376108.1 hypothetical protein BYT42DRAFT_573440 [Radiomyces spectabilis]